MLCRSSKEGLESLGLHDAEPPEEQASNGAPRLIYTCFNQPRRLELQNPIATLSECYELTFTHVITGSDSVKLVVLGAS
jgi:hypothetical protein